MSLIHNYSSNLSYNNKKVLKIKKLRRVTLNKKRKVLPLSVVLIFIFAAMINVFSLSSFSQETKNKKTSHTVAVSAISIAVTVQDKKGRYINDLTRKIFLFMRTMKRGI